MKPPTSFDDLPVLGKLPPAEVIAKLREMDDMVTADALQEALEDRPLRAQSFAGGTRSWWPFEDKPWQHTAHAFGYIAPSPRPGSEAPLPIRHAGNIAPDPSLKNARVIITLDRLRVAGYPGSGTHRVLFDFSAQNQVPGTPEHLHFNATYRAREGEQVGMIGYPLFVGLNVGSEGLSFKCFTVNVKNDADEAFLGFLDSDVFKNGLQLAAAAQPAIAPLSAMAEGLTRAIAKRNRNVPVQDFYMGLDFGAVPTGARLAVGTYLAVQIPETLVAVWNWDGWEYDPRNGQIVDGDHATKLIPYNYVAFGVRRYEGA